MPSQTRIQSLDILRFAAVIGVIGVHSYPMTMFAGHDPISVAIVSVFQAIGWTGVDLFFVLSGFLVAGLLFSEYKKTGEIDAKRFYIRRGFKIYPAYFFLLACSVLYDLAYPFSVWWHQRDAWDGYAASALFIQNYYDPTHMIWFHTWSLPIEEHFYLILPLVLIGLATINKWRTDAFKHLPKIFIGVAMLIIANRMYLELGNSPSLTDAATWTHLRIDELFFGVVIAYYWHFEPEKLAFARKWPQHILLAGMIIFAAALLIRNYGVFGFTFGTTFLYLAFGSILLVSLNSQNLERFGQTKGGRFMAYFGRHSYSIYLWHAPVKFLNVYLFNQIDPWPYQTLRMNILYLILSLAMGVITAKLVEFPFLKLRDRISTISRGASIIKPIEMPA
jgi:peptidoglycan/LPS O-acetylase OafA/YrhL